MIGLAVLVFGVSAMLDTLASRALSGLAGKRLSEVALTLAISLLTGPLSFSTAGLVLYAGMLDRIVGHHLHGHERVTVRSALRTLPWARLLAADVILVIGTTIGAALFVVPGLVVFTLFCLVGPLVNIEGIGVAAAFSRSAALVRRAPWPTMLLATIPTYVEITLVHGFQFATAEQPYLTAFIVSAVVGATVGATVGLFEVTLSYELLNAERASAHDSAVSAVDPRHAE
ncbi:MAG TPA: hypothetical protein VFD90_05110 [Gaiellales bacterium]|nr:hypothetical protein [Gaiellales bacterium]